MNSTSPSPAPSRAATTATLSSSSAAPAAPVVFGHSLHPGDAAAMVERQAICCALYSTGPGPLLDCGLRDTHFSSRERAGLWRILCADAKNHASGLPDGEAILRTIAGHSEDNIRLLALEFGEFSINSDPRHAVDYARQIIARWRDRTVAQTCDRIVRIQSGACAGDVTAELAALERLRSEGLPDPVPVQQCLLPVPAFSADLIPVPFLGWLTDAADRIGCPLEFLAIPAIVAAGSVAGRKLGIRPKERDDWTEFPNLWGALIGRPSTMKSPALSEALRPLAALEAAARETWQEEMTQHEKAMARRGIERDAAREGAKKAARKGLAFDVDTFVDSGSAAPPALRRYTATKCSLQALVEILRHNPNGLLLTHDELAGLLAQLDQPGNEDMRAFYLTAWTGRGAFTLDTIGRGLDHHLPAVCLSMLGGIQPARLAAHVREAVHHGAGDDGFVQRLQCAVWPDDTGTWRAVDRWPDTISRDCAAGIYEELSQLDPRVLHAETDPHDGTQFLRFAPDLVPGFLRWMEALTARARTESLTLPAMEAHLIKYRGLLPRLALIFHLINGHKGPVNGAAYELALRWVELLEAHARRIYTFAAAPDGNIAERLRVKLASAVREGRIREPFKASDVYRHGWSGLNESRAVTAALEVLAAHHWLIEEPPLAFAGAGRRPTPEYRLHPAAREARTPAATA